MLAANYLDTLSATLASRTPKCLSDDALRLFQEQNIQEALKLLNNALLLYPESLWLLEAKISILQEINAYESAAQLVKIAYNKRKHKLNQSGHASSFDTDYLNPAGRILISGYFYSGSGAVLDYLKGFSATEKFPFTKGEARIVKFPGGVAEIGKKVKKNQRLSTKACVQFYLHLIGKQMTHGPQSHYNMAQIANKNSRRIIKDDRSQSYVYQGLKLLDEYFSLSKKGKISHQTFVSTSSEGLRKMMDAAAQPNQIRKLLIDQIVTAWRLNIACYLPPSSFIIVHRDPRDQFAEAKEALSKPGRSPWSAEAFVEIYKKRRVLVDNVIPILEKQHNHRFLRVAFEDFVINHETESQKILEFVGLNKNELIERRFIPEISIKNIGKYKSILTKNDIACLEKGLPEYLR